jgi:hypothetical protein
MMTLSELHTQRMDLYYRYERGELDRKEYLRLLKPLDDMVEKIEMAFITFVPREGDDFDGECEFEEDEDEELSVTTGDRPILM